MRVLGMIKRNFRNLDSQSLKTLYCSFLRPHMEHCVQAWSPYLKKDVKTLERVQRRASKLVPALRNLSYEDWLKKIGILPLEQRRFRGDLIEIYKILHGIENIDGEIFFERAKLATLRGNSLKLFKKRSRLSVRNHFFPTRDWWLEYATKYHRWGSIAQLVQEPIRSTLEVEEVEIQLCLRPFSLQQITYHVFY